LIKVITDSFTNALEEEERRTMDMINKKFEGSENQLNSTSNFGTPPLN